MRASLRVVTAAAFSATFLLLLLAVALGGPGTWRLGFVLTTAGIGFSGALLDFLSSCFARRRGVLGLAVVSLAVSLATFLALAWGFRSELIVWRIWWGSTLLTLTVAHLGALAWIAADPPALLDRVAAFSAVVAGALLASLAFRSTEQLLRAPALPLLLPLVAAMAVAAISTLALWRRFVRRKVQLSRFWGRLKGAAIAVVVLLSFLGGYYTGRVNAPPANPADVFPSVLRGMSPERLDAQIDSDLKRLRTVAVSIDDLASRAEELRAALDAAGAAEDRGVLLPREDSEVRWLFATYLSHRTALLRLLATYSGFQTIDDPDRRARAFVVGFASAVTVFENSLRLVQTYRDHPLAARKLDEPEPSWGIPAGMFTELYRRVTQRRNFELAEEMAAYYAERRDGWRRAGVFEEAEYQWLDQRIEDGMRHVRQHPIHPLRAYVDLLVARVREDSYTPVYAVQSLVSEWLGDTRLLEREPFVKIPQIEAIESELRPGDILLERRNWYLSNAFLPGFWPHAAIYVGRLEDLQALGIADRPEVRRHLEAYLQKSVDGRDHTVIEAVSEGVIFNSLTHSMHADYVAVLRPRLSDGEIGDAIVRAFSHNGKPYDFEFDFFTSHQLVCTEVVYRAYEGALHFDLVDVMGRKTLPAVEIARKFVQERHHDDRELDLVLFLDGDPRLDRARRATVEEFCKSIERPQAFHVSR